MNNRDIPADKINEAVVMLLGWKRISSDEFLDLHGNRWIVGDYQEDCFCGNLYNMLTNHDQFHEIWTPEMEAKACDVLHEWLYRYFPPEKGGSLYWWDFAEYQANRRLWQLRAVCEVMGNGNNT